VDRSQPSPEVKGALSKFSAAEKAALAQLPAGSKLVAADLVTLVDGPGPGGPTRELAWAFQSLPRGGYVVPSDGPPGLKEGLLRPNFRVDFVNASSGRWVMATESSSALTRAAALGRGCPLLGGPPVRVSGPIGARLGDRSPPPGMVATYQPDPGQPVREVIYQRPRDINPPKGAPPVRDPPYLQVYVRLTTMPFSQLFDMRMAPTIIGGHKAVLGYLAPPVGSWTAAWRANGSTVVFLQSNLSKSQFLSSAAGVFYSPGTLPPLLPAPRGEVPPACRRLPEGALPAHRVVRLFSARGLSVQAKLVRFSQLARFANGLSGDPGNAVGGLVVWLVLEQAPDNHLAREMCNGPVCKFPAGPSWVMFPVDAATGERSGYTASGMGRHPAYWGALVDLAP
jgi:hypothetical protein